MPAGSAPIPSTFVVDFSETGKTVAEINRSLLAQGIFGGKDLSNEFPQFGQSALYCVTEIHTQDDIERLFARLRHKDAALAGGTQLIDHWFIPLGLMEVLSDLCGPINSVHNTHPFLDLSGRLRREHGKEYVGTQSALWGITAGVYLATMGPRGMEEVGETILYNAIYRAACATADTSRSMSSCVWISVTQ